MSGLRTPELEAIIIEGLSEGTPLRQIARENGFSKSSFYTWLEEDKDFAGRIARARDLGFDEIAADCLTIIDEDPERVITTSGEDRVESRIDSASVQRAKNRAEMRLKLLAKWDPKRYGEKQTVENLHGLTEEAAAWLGLPKSS